MVEVGGAVTGDDDVNQAHFLAYLGLEVTDALGVGELSQLGGGKFVPLHIQDRGGAEFAGHEALVELEALLDLLHKGRRDGLAGFPIVGIVGQNLGHKGKVLVELGEHFHKVAGHIGSGHRHIVALAQEAVQGMSKLMEGGLHVVNGKEAGLRFGGICAGGREVADVHNDGTHTGLLLAEVVHPCAAALGGTHIVVSVEDANQGTVGVGNLVGLDGGLVHLNLAGHFLKLEAVDLGSGGEHTLHHAVGLEIRLGLALVQGVLLGTHLLGVVAPVPGFNLVTGYLLHLLELSLGAAHSGVHNGLQEVVHGLGVAGHLVGKLIGSKVGIAQELGHFGPQAQGFQYDGVVVVLVSVVAAGAVGLEHLLALGAVIARAHKVIIFAHGDAGGLLEGVVLGHQVLAELLAEHSQTGADLGEALLGLGSQAHAVALETFIDFLHHHLLLTGEAGRLLVHGLDAGIEVLVHHNLVGSLGDQGHHLFFDGLHLGSGITLGEVEEHALYLVQDGAGVLIGKDGILEGRGLRIGQNGLDIGLLLLQAGLEGGHILVCGNLGEGGGSVRGVPLLQEDVGGFLRVASGKHSHSCKKD